MATRNNGEKWIIGWIWGTLLLLALWRTLLALGGVSVHWLRLDEFVPWFAVGLLLFEYCGIARGTQTLGSQRAIRLLTVMACAGVLLTAAGVLLDQFSLAPHISTIAAFGGYVLLALCSAGVALGAGRQVYRGLRADAVTGTPRAGITIIELWRFAGAQWGLLMAVAVLVVISLKSRDQRFGDLTIRDLFFFLPAAAVLPNAMMAAGISVGDDLIKASEGPRAVPRVRAWLAAFILANVAPSLILLSILPRLNVPWLIFPGALLEFLAIALYLLGFPQVFWRQFGAKLLLASWGCIVFGLGAAAVHQLLRMNQQPMTPNISAAWRYVWSIGACTLWLLSIGTLAWETFINSKGRGMILAVFAAAVAGIGTTAAGLLIARDLGDARGPVTVTMLIGGLLGSFAILAAGLLLLRFRAQLRITSRER